MDCVMGWEIREWYPLSLAVQSELIQESTVKDNSSVVIWLAHVIVVIKVRIQTSE